ncbi:hypothetical protein M3Y99_00724400 [Aphelenchoides fujianensis]|nr:hypothetical protein M3Y99_00724400 [Aphelenchoides fujianensis]
MSGKKKWERDVELRRINVRAKAQQERERQEAAQNEQKQRQDESAAAARYAKQQESYLSVHVRAMEEQERLRKSRNPAPLSMNQVPPPEQAAAYQQTALAPVVPQQPQRMVGLMDTIGVQPPLSAFDRATAEEEAIKRGPHIQADPQPMNAHGLVLAEAEVRPSLWGEEGSDYLPHDLMFLKWGAHAAPPNLRTPYRPPVDPPAGPSWYLQKGMEEAGLFCSTTVRTSGIPELIAETAPAAPNGVKAAENGRLPQPNGADGPRPPAIVDFSRPPPGFQPAVAQFAAPPPFFPLESLAFNVPPPQIHPNGAPPPLTGSNAVPVAAFFAPPRTPPMSVIVSGPPPASTVGFDGRSSPVALQPAPAAFTSVEQAIPSAALLTVINRPPMDAQSAASIVPPVDFSLPPPILHVSQ